MISSAAASFLALTDTHALYFAYTGTMDFWDFTLVQNSEPAWPQEPCRFHDTLIDILRHRPQSPWSRKSCRLQRE